MNEKMRTLREFVLGHPASTVSEATAKLSMERRRLLRSLVDVDGVRLVVTNGRELLVPDLKGIEECVGQIRVLRNPALVQLYGCLAGRGVVRCAVIEHQTAQWSWNRRTTRHRLRLLVQQDLARRIEQPVQDRRWRWIEARPPVQLTQRVLNSDSFLQIGLQDRCQDLRSLK